MDSEEFDDRVTISRLERQNARLEGILDERDARKAQASASRAREGTNSIDAPAPQPSAPKKDSRSQQLNENERGNPNGVNATDPNWGKLTESLQDMLAPLADRGEWTKWDKLVEDRNARAMEDMRKMAREAFAFYPTEIVDVFIN